jgi:hypothetical protein
MTTEKQNINDCYHITFTLTDQQVNVIEKCLITYAKNEF